MKSHYSNHLQVVALIALAISSAPTSSIFAQTNSATTATNRITDPTLRPRPAENKALIDAAVAKLPPIQPGPVQPTWESISANFKDPEWFRDAKFGIMMHWGIYSVPAHGS